MELKKIGISNMKMIKENIKIQVESNRKMERRESTTQEVRLCGKKAINDTLAYLNQTLIILPGKEHNGASS